MDANGNILQDRIYSPNGKVIKDIDYFHNEKPGSYFFLHEHNWDWAQKNPRQYKKYMDKAKYYDYIVAELFNNHSLAALVVSIGAGRELDFRYKDVPYSITFIDNKVKLENGKRR